MAARHKNMSSGRMSKGRATGGSIESLNPAYDVMKEANARKRGGKVAMKMDGAKGAMRLDRPARKSGGRVGSDKSPLSSANSNASPAIAPRSQSDNGNC